MSTAGSIEKLLEATQCQVATLEQELRETAGYVEQLKTRVETGNRLRAESDAALGKATALLERVHKWCNEPAEPGKGDLGRIAIAVQLFLSRAPAQPAAPTPERALTDYDVSDGFKYAPPDDLDHTRCTPASGRLLGMSPIPRPDAPAPEYEDSQDRCARDGSLMHVGKCVHCGQPAAPEPSAEHDWLELIHLRAVVKGTTSTAPIVHFMLRAESAEAQLAAVRKLLAWTIMCVPTPWPMPREIGLAVQREIKGVVIHGNDLLTAPSPGAGEETL